ncbi:MAG: hypothetical protein JSR61_20005 [Proteobacteria bacterium]|nr:hypothetical protein [Pseudomonadota bacterium]
MMTHAFRHAAAGRGADRRSEERRRQAEHVRALILATGARLDDVLRVRRGMTPEEISAALRTRRRS